MDVWLILSPCSIALEAILGMGAEKCHIVEAHLHGLAMGA